MQLFQINPKVEIITKQAENLVINVTVPEALKEFIIIENNIIICYLYSMFDTKRYKIIINKENNVLYLTALIRHNNNYKIEMDEINLNNLNCQLINNYYKFNCIHQAALEYLFNNNKLNNPVNDYVFISKQLFEAEFLLYTNRLLFN